MSATPVLERVLGRLDLLLFSLCAVLTIDTLASAASIGPVKAMLRSLDAAALGRYLRGLLELPDHSLRGRLQAYAQDHGVVLPPRVYQPF